MRGISFLTMGVAACLGLGLAGCSGGGSEVMPVPMTQADQNRSGGSTENISFRSLYHAELTGVEMAQDRVFTDAAAWNAFRQEHPNWNLPDIDFSREHVAATFLGFRSMGAHRVQVQRVTRNDASAGGQSGSTELVIRVEETRPGNGCAVPAVATTPAEIVAYSAQPDAPHFAHETEYQHCE